jgi:hypothetical protein
MNALSWIVRSSLVFLPMFALIAAPDCPVC